MFKRLLIANRGEIACRIMRTAKKMGITCIAIYSEADEQAQHVKLADEAYRVGPSPSQESYLNIANIIRVAKQAQADAVHPGYGFLAENADFAMACAAANLIFVGPSAHAMQKMSHKGEAKQLMAAANIPLLPSYYDQAQELTTLQTMATQIGYPILIKAVAGGGGKGMRVVWQAAEFAEQFAAAKREAFTSFGNEGVLIEKFLLNPRHIEVQIFADQQGNIVHLFERDCSIQRRYQKIIEEAPAPHLPEAIKTAMYQAAIKACQAINYVGAGTVEFIYTAEQQFYFMEMNTRLQVEHPITELITGLDLVEWQLRVAAGEPLPLSQAEIKADGHAIEVRICAENPIHNFLPSTGKIHHLKWPGLSQTLRIDTGISAGDQITAYYDSMLAKLIVHAANRNQTIAQLQQAIAGCEIAGIHTNLALLAKIAASKAFKAAELSTQFMQHYEAELLNSLAPTPPSAWLAASVYVLLQQQLSIAPTRPSPWHTLDGWRLNGPAYQHRLTLTSEQQTKNLTIQFIAPAYLIRYDEQNYLVKAKRIANRQLQLTINGQTLTGHFTPVNQQLHLVLDNHYFVFEQVQPDYHNLTPAEHSLTSPLPGVITAIFVELGQKVQLGESLMTIEAMKMEHIIRAPYAGIIAQIYHQVGQVIEEGKDLIDLLQLTEPC